MTHSTTPSSTPGREIVAGLLGAGIALGCVLPPLIHVVTGPMGPLIGGFVVANHLRPGARGRALIALTLGACLAALAAGAALAIGAGYPDELPSWMPSPDLLALIVTGIFAYGALLGFGGTILGSALASKKAAQAEQPTDLSEPGARADGA